MQEIFKQRFAKLNPQQKDAVNKIEGATLVLAGPGSGKTELLAMRVANILQKTDTPPGSILCLTFTESAADNMRRRLIDMIGPDGYKVAIMTFHGFCRDVINQYPEKFFGGVTYNPADALVSANILYEILETLPLDDPFRSYHDKLGFAYLKDIKSAISEIKRAGLSPEQFANLVSQSAQVLPSVQEVLEPLLVANIRQLTEEDVNNYVSKLLEIDDQAAYTKSLAEQLKLAGRSGLSRFKASIKDGLELKDFSRLAKLATLSLIYNQYQNKMWENGYFDFDDMLLLVLDVLERDQDLLMNLQERYLYLSVDEYQDTNDAQLKILSYLTQNIFEGEMPNILVVGDDDQAIYKFQGATKDNISKFLKQYKGAFEVLLTKNYRSTQEIIDVANLVIESVRTREKLLESQVFETKTDIISAHLPTREQEYIWVKDQVNDLIKSGVKPGEIAIIARTNAELNEMASILKLAKLPVMHAADQVILDQPQIQQLINIATFCYHLIDKNQSEYLLPEILSYPFWQLKCKYSARQVVELILDAKQSRISIWSLLKEKPEFSFVYGFLTEIAFLSASTPSERLLEAIIGSERQVSENNDEDSQNTPFIEEMKLLSPYKQYFFSLERLKSSKDQYIEFLSSLHGFLNSLRSFKEGRPRGLKDIVEYVAQYQNSGENLINHMPLIENTDSIYLLTAHGAKGMEFEKVFVIACNERNWLASRKRNKISYPFNLDYISRIPDENEDFLRLLYVALTRAKNTLYLSSHKQAINDKVSDSRIALLPEASECEVPIPEIEDITNISWTSYYDPANLDSGRMKALLSNYRLTVTHLNTFLDVKYAGPEVFYRQQLLRFPQPMTPSSIFGSAIHLALKTIGTKFKISQTLPSLSEIEEVFKDELASKPLSDHEFNEYLRSGQYVIRDFLENYGPDFGEKDLLEFSFADQGVIINNVPINGAIDRIVISDNQMKVFDYKTGSAPKTWGSYTSAWKHEMQILFYKLLVENSRDFAGKFIVNCGELIYLQHDKNEMASFEVNISDQKLEETKQLISIVYQKIMNLDFPDISHYNKPSEFISDLLSGDI